MKKQCKLKVKKEKKLKEKEKEKAEEEKIRLGLHIRELQYKLKTLNDFVVNILHIRNHLVDPWMQHTYYSLDSNFYFHDNSSDVLGLLLKNME